MGEDKLETISLTSPVEAATNGLSLLYRGRRGIVRANEQIHHNTWDTLLCEGVPVSLREIVLLTADILGVPVNIVNGLKLLRCSWYLGWHVHTVSLKGVSRHYWGGGVTPRTTSNYLRGDWIETNITEDHNGVTTSRLARVICGVRISNLRQRTGFEIPPKTWQTQENKEKDTVVFLLVRYAQPHASTGNRRGPNHRPLCPGNLKETHCLWSWAKRRAVGVHRGCLRGRAWDRNKHFFGDTEASQNKRKDSEERAWYDLVLTSEISSYANVQLDPDREDAFLQSVMWC